MRTHKLLTVLLLSSTPAGACPTPPPDASAPAALLEPRGDLIRAGHDKAQADASRFRALCDKDGYPLVGTGRGGHRLELARGRIAARVAAPPRLFVIDTPVASAVDLGCAYELGVDDDGAGCVRAAFRGGELGLQRMAATMITPRRSRTRRAAT